MFSCKFNGDILFLDLLVCAFVGSGVSNTVGSGVRSGVGSGVDSGLGILSRLFIRTFFLFH